MRRTLRLAAPAAVLALGLGAVPLLTTSSAGAADFAGGDVVVYRVGTGAAALTNAAAPVFLDRFAPGGALVSSTPLPTASATGNARLTAAGQSRSEGLIGRSSDGRVVAVTGYDAAVGATGAGGLSLTTTSPLTVGRVVGLVDGNGTVDTSTALRGSAVPTIVRSAATVNGSRVWVGGGSGGVLTAPFASTTATSIAGGATANLTGVSVQGGRLFAASIRGSRLATVGTGTPTTATTLAGLSGLPENLLAYGYVLLDLTAQGFAGTTLDTLYLANASEKAGVLDKYRFDGTTWTRAGGVDIDGIVGVVAVKTGGTGVSLAVTTPTQLLTLTEADGSSTGFTASAPAVAATAAANTEFRGVALAPTGLSGPSVFLRSAPATASLASTGLPVSAYVAAVSPKTVASVRIKLGTKAFVNAVKGSNGLWSATAPVTGLALGAQTLTVEAKDSAGGTTTVTRPVTVAKIIVPAGAVGPGTVSPRSALVKKTGTWKSFAYAGSPDKKGLVATKKNAKASATVFGRSLVLTLVGGPKAGKAKVTVDGRTVTVNLYAKKAKTISRSYTFASGAVTKHTVVVTVTGKKVAKSKGTKVSIGSLRVTA